VTRCGCAAFYAPTSNEVVVIIVVLAREHERRARAIEIAVRVMSESLRVSES
jgi:hypothetical protein